MDLAQYKVIFFWEWLHRLLGRLVGLAFALPLAWFAWKRAIPKGYGWRLLALLLLGASQGALGWYMVQSGLADRTDVSHFRLVGAPAHRTVHPWRAGVDRARPSRAGPRRDAARAANRRGHRASASSCSSSCCSAPGSPG